MVVELVVTRVVRGSSGYSGGLWDDGMLRAEGRSVRCEPRRDDAREWSAREKDGQRAAPEHAWRHPARGETDMITHDFCPACGADLHADEYSYASDPCECGFGTAAVRALRREAGLAGDRAQVAICDRALAGDHGALRACGEVIADARAQE